MTSARRAAHDALFPLELDQTSIEDAVTAAFEARDDEHLAREAAERTRMLVALRDVVARLAAAVGVELEVLIPRPHARAVGLTPARQGEDGSE